VAVKVLRPEYATDVAIVDAFRFEARATSDLDSPYLVKIHDFFELPDGRSALVMELLDGVDLARREDPVMAPERVVAVGRQVCKALHAVHEGGLVHRDLKPENIFLCSDGGCPDAVRVLDFGIARLTAQATSAQSGGTPLYTAPEVILGGAQGRTADIYALGCVLYELLTGTTAFGRDTVDLTLRAHLEEPPPAPSSLVPTVPTALGAVVMRALSREPRDRYATMAELEAALCEAQVEAGFTTSCDNLPLPSDIPPDQRSDLLARMPDPVAPRVAPRRGLIAAILASTLVTGAVVLGLTHAGDNPVESLSPEQRKAQALAREARMAGSRAAWVYPPPDDVSGRTAYQAVLALEARGPDGQPLAASLRSDFATTLTRLGDEYWDAEGGTRFAVAYYEQALLFERTSAHARERSTMAKGSLDAFAERAANGRFAVEELVRVEPLIALAVRDDRPPSERISRVRRKKTPTQDAPSALFQPALSDQDDTANGAPAKSAADETARDPDAARALTSQAKRVARKNATKAKLLYVRALSEDPRSVAAHAGLRDLAFDAGDYARAVRHGKRAASLAPRNASHQLRLGDAYYTRKYAPAERAYAAAAKLGDERAKWRLDRAREKLGR
jgi:hypothetical protein